ncbi:unnamed protein product [Rotaria sordida]|uniref:C2 domain-containing protein n=1 Tax=Rotaria sordida TaxID=392033 RepID=A0A814CMB6_9BILA|nr:unnamed protein product [Rotaria sordida]CAF1106160.1 unnamed protein product [Rotaria sordida]
MSKSSKASRPAGKSGGGAALMQQMGFQIPNFNQSGMGDDDDDDDDLEAELRRLQQGTGDGNQKSRGAKSNQGKLGGMGQDLQLFHNDVHKLLHDIDRPINDDELSDVDEDELLAELNEITDEIDNERYDQAKQPRATSSGNIVSVLEGRQEMYVKALAAAKASSDVAKSRRLDRQLKTIQELLQSARAGVSIDESNIPPEVFIASQSTSIPQQTPIRAPSPPPPQPAAPRPRVVPLPQPPPPASVRTNNDNRTIFKPQAPPMSTDSDPAITRLKSLALQAKQQGDMAKAKEYIIQLRALQNKVTSTVSSSAQKETYDNVPEDDDGPPPALPLKAPEPRTIMEALQQRHEELAKRGEEAARSGDNSKARRMERLSKQYDEAIDATRKGRPYNYSELPDLPGFAPIPVQQSKPQPVASSSSATAAKSTSSHSQARSSQLQQQRPLPSAAATTTISTRKSQQAQTLRLKQEKFQKLAVQAKQKGDLETAKKFLVAYKGLEQMILAAESGLPIDMSQVPKLPDDDNDMLDDDDLTQDLARADRDTVYRRLQDDLLRQIQLCARNQQTYAQMEGINNVKHTNEYKVLEQRCANDLEKLRQCFQHGLKPPLFHYERRQMNIVQVNNDLGDNDLEVTILRGINLPVPSGQSSSSLETYVAIEFPYPTETPQTARTRHTIGSVNAEYPDSLHKFYIKRNDAKFRRLMNRKELKLAVFYKAGFLRSDRPLGIASMKLATLEQSCTIHESVDLYESEHKKKIEGKLEVKLRIKEALGQTKASDILPQRWLVIDRFEELSQHGKSSSTSNQSNTTELTNRQRRRQHQEPVSSSTSTNPQSVQVLNYESSLIQQQIEQLHDRLSPDQLRQLKIKRREIEEQSDRLVEFLRMGGKLAVQEHVRGLEELNDYYDQEAREYHQRRETKKADIALTKKKLVMKEIDTLTGQPSSTKF